MKLSKTSIIAAACLGAVALTSVGFAGWYIVSDAHDNQSGNITVYEISNKALVISDGKWDNATDAGDNKGTGDVIFGHPSSQESVTSAWLQYNSTSAGGATVVEKERLTPSYSFNLTDYSGSSSDNSKPVVTAQLKIKRNSTESGSGTGTGDDVLFKNYYNCITAGTENGNAAYITGPALVGFDNSSTYTANNDVKASTSDTATGSDNKGLKIEYFTDNGNGGGASGTTTTSEKTYKLKVTITFGWGDHFKEENGTACNPYIYYNNKKDGASKDNVDDAYKAMTAVNGLSGLGYDLTITATNNQDAA